MKRLDIDTELVIDMYVNQKINTREIGKKLNAHQTTVCRILKQLGVKMRTMTEIKTIELDIEKMVDMYVNQKINTREIGEKLNVHQMTVRRKLKQLGVKIRSKGEARTIEVDIVKLEDMYVNQKMSSTKIGEIMGVSAYTIRKKLKILCIPRRSKLEAAMLRNTQKKKDYSRDNMSTRNIVGRGSSCIEHQHFSGGPNLGNQTPIRKRLGGNSPNPTSI